MTYLAGVIDKYNNDLLDPSTPITTPYSPPGTVYNPPSVMLYPTLDHPWYPF
jgi:hypothetical protein